MSKNPVVNAISASIYITLVVAVMNFISRTLGEKPDTVFAPVAFLSLLTLSAAVMAYLFFYQPLQFLISGKKKWGINLFVRTVGVFGAITIVELMLMYSGLI